MPRKAAKVDANQADIVEALRAIGATVTPAHTMGKGFPDLVVGYRGETYLLEVKTEDGKLTSDQKVWHADWRGHKAIVRTKEEAWEAIGAEVE